jgi:hypothetical protein
VDTAHLDPPDSFHIPLPDVTITTTWTEHVWKNIRLVGCQFEIAGKGRSEALVMAIGDALYYEDLLALPLPVILALHDAVVDEGD